MGTSWVTGLHPLGLLFLALLMLVGLPAVLLLVPDLAAVVLVGADPYLLPDPLCCWFSFLALLQA